jgi:hypothetical protein
MWFYRQGKVGGRVRNLKALLLQYGRQYQKELYNIDFDKVVSTEEELMDMLPKGFTPGPRETTADETGDVRTTDENSKPTSFGRSRCGHGDGLWQVDSSLKEDETLLEAAKRAVKEKVGEEVEFGVHQILHGYGCFSGRPTQGRILRY